MKLINFHVTNFQSVYDSSDIAVGEVTCLVGKNESGKTAILKALSRINPQTTTEASFDVTDDYPRRLASAYKRDMKRGDREHDIVVTATFELDATDILEIKRTLGPGFFTHTTPVLVLRMGYSNRLQAVLAEVDHDSALKHLIEQADLTRSISADLLSQPDASKLLSAVHEQAGSTDMGSFPETLEGIVASGLDQYVYDRWLKARTPKFLYFDEYYQLKGEENLDGLRERQVNDTLEPPDYPMLGLLQLAQIELDDIIEPDRTEELLGTLNAAENYLTEQALPYWTQNQHLQMKFDIRPARPGDPEGLRDGLNIWGRIYDNKRMAETSLGTRSRGFQWFISFLAWYSQLRTQEGDLILLLDEPGLSLHANAQADLLRYFEQELRPHHQIIYTTHSPFMVDPNHFERVRIVQDLSIESELGTPASAQQGTTVIQEVLDATPDSLFPLQGALGYEIHQTLFVGPNCLIVEGASDLLYLQTVSGILQAKGREGLRPGWTITPVGGADKVPTFVALIGAKTNLNLVTLIDVQAADEQRIEELYKRKLLQKKNVHTWADFLSQSEADIEDMFEPSFYLALVNSEFGTQFELSDLKSQNPRILVRVEEHIEKNPLPKGVTFNHYRPSRYFAEKVKKMAKQIDDKTLDRFQKAFDAVNALLPT